MSTTKKKDKAPLIVTTVETPKQAKAGAIVPVSLAPLGVSSEKDMAAQIIADHQAFEFASRHVSLLALRIGLRLVWVKNNGGHGSLEPFIKEHFAGEGKPSRRSCFNYIRIADQFVTDCGLRDKAHKLTNGEAIKALVQPSHELLSHPGAKPSPALAQAVEWINGRTLTQIYSDLSQEEQITLPPAGGGEDKKKPAKKTPEEKAREEFKAALTAFKAPLSKGQWHHLHERDRLALEKWLGESYRKVKEHNAACAKEKRKGPKKGGTP